MNFKIFLLSFCVTDASPDDSLTTLAWRILDVEPSIKGLNLDTSLVITTT